MRISGWLLVLTLLAIAAAAIDEWAYPPRKIMMSEQRLTVADGDSFTVGTQKLRLDGIDAPEYLQTCEDGTGSNWECGKVARASLEQMVRLPGLICIVKATDKYGRSVAKCSTTTVPDISSAQVLAGMAVSHDYYGIRDYGDDEDIAQTAKRGIWAGNFIPPAEWRNAKEVVAAPPPDK